jgi:16S rRNA (guanine(1405)-N(7))-methyltransferase
MIINELAKQEIKKGILNSAKYRNKGLNPETIQDLIDRETGKHKSIKQLQKAVRKKLHNIVAPYLGEPDYDQLSRKLARIRDQTLAFPELRSYCLDVLNLHASTSERISQLDTFYETLFEVTGKPETILDLACGFHPLSFPWMGLPLSTRYHAFDIIQPRIDFINSFFNKIGLEPLAKNQDILVSPPDFHADLGLFFKEAHRFEKRNPGCNKTFFASLNVDYLAVSLPTSDLSGNHSLADYHRELISRNIPSNKGISELQTENEILFIIEHPGF